MNKLKLMSQRGLKDAVLYCVTSEPGISSEKLWRAIKDWNGQTSVGQFEGMLESLLDKELRCTNKCWYTPGAQREQKLREPKVDARQTRMDW